MVDKFCQTTQAFLIKCLYYVVFPVFVLCLTNVCWCMRLWALLFVLLLYYLHAMYFTFVLDLQDIHNVANLVLPSRSISFVLNIKVYAKCLHLNVNVPQIIGFSVQSDNGNAKRLKNSTNVTKHNECGRN